jgi:FixJ family two-component response regulator
MARLKLVPKKEQPKLAVHAVTLTPDVVEAIQQLSQDASDFLGRKVSGSAILRALVRQVVKQGPPAADALFLEVEKELKAGVRWGKKK